MDHMRVLITGMAGFIGSNLLRAFSLERGFKVIGVDDLSSGSTDLLPLGSRCHPELLKCDFADSLVTSRVENGEFDVVVHLAAIPSVPVSFEQPYRTEYVNVLNSIRLMTACKKSNTRLVFASSAAVYGDTPSHPTKESDPVRPISPYGHQKASVESYLKYLDVPHVVLRFFNVYGPRQLFRNAYSSVVSSWCRSILRGDPLVIEGGQQTRDFCHVDDLCQVIIEACHGNYVDSKSVINVASGRETTVDELSEVFARIRPGIEFVRRPRRHGDIGRSVADVSKMRQLRLGSTTTLSDGIRQTIEWYEREGRWIK